MKVLVTGNHGYIGSIMTHELLKRGHEVIGIDCDYFPPEFFGREDAFKSRKKVQQISKDLRDITFDNLKDIEAVIHLAALPNDWAGDINPDVTQDINFLTTVQLAIMAKRAGVQRFLFSSSCSVYGASGDSLINENHAQVPVTPYGIAKVRAEKTLRSMDSKDFSVTFMRNATAYGVSPRMRFDMVLNNLVGYAFTEGKVKILSDGSAWRPIVHIEDISQAFILALEASKADVAAQTFNVVGENFTVREMAEIVKNNVPNSIVEYAATNYKDPRSYNVDFSKIQKFLGYQPKWTAEKGVKELYEAYKKFGLTKESFQHNEFFAGKQFRHLLETGKIDENFRIKSKLKN